MEDKKGASFQEVDSGHPGSYYIHLRLSYNLYIDLWRTPNLEDKKGASFQEVDSGHPGSYYIHLRLSYNLYIDLWRI